MTCTTYRFNNNFYSLYTSCNRHYSYPLCNFQKINGRKIKGQRHICRGYCFRTIIQITFF